MSRLRRAAYRAAVGLAIMAILLGAAVVATARRGDPNLFPAKDSGTLIYVVSHGYHSGLVLSRDRIAALAGEGGHAALINIAARFGAYPYLEIGWGEERFYREVPTVSAINWQLALRSLFLRGNLSVLHVVGLPTDPREIFPLADVVRLDLSVAGVERLVAELDGTFARQDGLPSAASNIRTPRVAWLT